MAAMQLRSSSKIMEKHKWDFPATELSLPILEAVLASGTCCGAREFCVCKVASVIIQLQLFQEVLSRSINTNHELLNYLYFHISHSEEKLQELYTYS